VTSSNGKTTTLYVANNCNQYTQVGSLLISYDRNGNMTSSTNGATYSYDAKNRLVEASSGSNTMSVTYDTRSRVVSRDINGTTTYYAYDGWNLIGEYDIFGNEQVHYVYGPGSDEPLCMVKPEGTYYYHQDGNGNVASLTDQNGNLVESYAYDPYGKPTIYAPNGSVRSASAVGNRFMFAGREYIAQLGLYDYRNRVYSPVYGRFLQTDPIRFQGGDYNIYRYCGNDPVDGKDAMGESWSVRVTGGAGIAAQVTIGYNSKTGQISVTQALGIGEGGSVQVSNDAPTAPNGVSGVATANAEAGLGKLAGVSVDANINTQGNGSTTGSINVGNISGNGTISQDNGNYSGSSSGTATLTSYGESSFAGVGFTVAGPTTPTTPTQSGGGYSGMISDDGRRSHNDCDKGNAE
jgi:RHS repeat-associated protein